jgi:hypothetical protein
MRKLSSVLIGQSLKVESSLADGRTVSQGSDLRWTFSAIESRWKTAVAKKWNAERERMKQ